MVLVVTNEIVLVFVVLVLMDFPLLVVFLFWKVQLLLVVHSILLMILMDFQVYVVVLFLYLGVVFLSVF